jgi:alpha-N-arabinofuranosidase
MGEVSGRILAAGEMNAHNTFDQPENLCPVAFQSFSTMGPVLTAELDAMSVVVLELG